MELDAICKLEHTHQWIGTQLAISRHKVSANIHNIKDTLAFESEFNVKKGSPISRRRSSTRLGKKLLVYFTEEERKIVDAAAAAERRSISSFVANAAIIAAEHVIPLTKRNRSS
jgi:hypothetical protein